MFLPGRDETDSCSVVDFFCLDRCEVIDRLVGSLVVEPVDPVQGAEFEMIDVSPGSFWSDQLGLVDADLGLGQGVVVGVAYRTHRRVHTLVDEPLGERE